MTKGLTSAAITTKAPVVVQDVSKDPRYLTAFESTGSEAIFPVLDREGVKVIGTVDIESVVRRPGCDHGVLDGISYGESGLTRHRCHGLILRK